MFFRAFLCAAALLLPGTGVSAQAWRSVVENETAAVTGASFCLPGDPRMPFCLALGCSTAHARHFLLTTAHDLPGSGTRSARIRVDGRHVGDLRFEREGSQVYRASWQPGLHDRIVAALSQGRRAQIILRPPDDAPALRLRLGLSGAGPRLAEAMAVCDRPGVTPVRNPAGQVFARLREQCGALGGAASRGRNFVSGIDLDGVPPMDIRLDYGEVGCPELAETLCRDGACMTALFQARPDGRYVHVFTGFAEGIRAETQRLVRMALPDGTCDAPPCETVFELSDGMLRPLD